ncbi:aldehyde dehydrogenase family protein [Chitinophaga sp. SYP-B3965]|uniref:aldehyde dehydrogenase (NADP(+)) n=1 Tax=Chitinophaga sp. SYP-B3965 TaxID=2663120 RepID=UPI001299C015|nr:aldehyde dehydrogenase (NADP(+)) [Chitinophaga sp. SYP-B3965]MRG43739.1 aldehyde dehydrogenase family protein [Chitinophaga sp. SYP-B3965]
MSQIAEIMQQTQAAFEVYSKTTPAQRAGFLQHIAEAIEAKREQLVAKAHEETHLPLPRLNNEITRTTGQLKMFAAYITEGSWVAAAIDNLPGKPDTRKMLVPIGPVVVFGASNFPFAFSTAGGDTASALASGSTVVVKGHSAHAGTSLLVNDAIQEAIRLSGMPEHTLQHVLGPGNSTGKELVLHAYTTGVGFTGSFSGGTALMRYAAEREKPIPVFAEMSSINPVVLLPDTLTQNAAALAKKLAGSITLGMGQFCTNPGLLLGIEGPGLEEFLSKLGEEITQVTGQPMLHEGIYSNYKENLSSKSSHIAYRGSGEPTPAIATVSAAEFLNNPHLREEVFGPFSLLVVCADKAGLKNTLQSIKGQLTATIMGTDKDLVENTDIIALQTSLAGRVIINDVPTGVEVNSSMVHGGPFPATSDARFTSVGTSAIQRWVRPVCFQGFPDALLPEELQNANPRGIWRTVNNEWKNS